MSMYHDRKITVRFTDDEYFLLLNAAQQMKSYGAKTVSRFIRMTLRDKLKEIGAQATAAAAVASSAIAGETSDKSSGSGGIVGHGSSTHPLGRRVRK